MRNFKSLIHSFKKEKHYDEKYSRRNVFLFLTIIGKKLRAKRRTAPASTGGVRIFKRKSRTHHIRRIINDYAA